MQKDDYDEDDILENAEYSHKSDFSKAEKVSNQVERCNQIRSKEMREGYFNFDRIGNKVYIPDSRKEWISSVIALKNLLKPEIIREKVFDEKTFLKKEETLIEKWGINKEGIKVIPFLDESFPIETEIISNSNIRVGKSMKMMRGVYNSNFHRFWNEMVGLYDEIFAQLNVLIDQCNYFKQELNY